MTASDLNRWLRSLHSVPEPSADRVIVGDAETLVKGIGVVWMPTWAVLRQAQAMGCNVVVAHEPTFFSHHDLDRLEQGVHASPFAQVMMRTREAKRSWIEEHGMVVIRCHDVLDTIPGGVADSFAESLGFARHHVLVRNGGYRVLQVDPPLKAITLAKHVATVCGKVGQPGIAFYGDPERVVSTLGIGTGYGCEPGRFVELGAGMCVTIDDRIKTWIEGEWADDAGYPMVVIHHGTSEEWGVRTLHDMICKKFLSTPVRLFRQGYTARWVPGAQ